MDKINSLVSTSSYDTLIEHLVAFGIKLGISIIVLVVGFFIVNKLEPLIKKTLEKVVNDITAEKFLVALIMYLLKGCVILMAVTKLGVETTSLVALVGAIGFAIGLAFQGALSNFAGGILILTLRPFSVDDYVEIADKSGTVHAISILTTTLYTVDNKVISIPNGNITSDSITNYSRLDTRRVDVTVGASYHADSKRVIEVLKSVVNSNEHILKDPEATVFLTSLGSSAVDYTVRVWTKTEDYWDVHFYLLEKIKIAFDEENIEIPYNKLDVNIIK